MNYRHSLSSKNAKWKINGAVLVEFALIMPFLLIFLTGLIEFGRFFSQLAWTSQTAYSSALRGARFNPEETCSGVNATPPCTADPEWFENVRAVGEILYYYNNLDFPPDPANPPALPVLGPIMLLGFPATTLGPIVPQYNYQNVTEGAFVDVTVRGQFRSLWPGFIELVLPIDQSVRAPRLTVPPALLNTFTDFENPEKLWSCDYSVPLCDCVPTPGGGCSDPSCGTSQC